MGARPSGTSSYPKRVPCFEAKRMSHARRNSFPAPRATPSIMAMEGIGK